MTKDLVLELHQADPFQPFQMLLVDGRSVAVNNPEFLLFADDNRCVRVFSPPAFSEMIDLALVVSVQYQEDSATGAAEA